MSNEVRKFAFLVHLRTFDDLPHAYSLLKYPMPVLKLGQRPIQYSFSRLEGRAGFSVRSKFRVGPEVEGHIILIWLTGEQVISLNQAHQVRQRILEAALHAQNNLGCKVIGLGALTSSITESGEWLVKQPGVKTAVTHGDAYSVCVASEGIQKLIRLTNLDFTTVRVAIVGATGLIGEGLTYQLAPLIKSGLILIGRNSKKLEDVKTEAERLGNKALVSLDIDDIKEADIVVTATSWPKALVGVEHLKEKAIVYEVSQPRNVSPLVCKERPDVLVVDGAFVRVPPGINFWWMSHLPHNTFACMAETLMQTLEGDFKNHVGKIDPGFVKEVGRRAGIHGFGHAPFTSFNEVITPERFAALAKK